MTNLLYLSTYKCSKIDINTKKRDINRYNLVILHVICHYKILWEFLIIKVGLHSVFEEVVFTDTAENCQIY